MHWMHLALSIAAALPSIVAAPVGHIFTHSVQAVQRPVTTLGWATICRMTECRIRLGNGFDILAMSKRIELAGG